MECSLISLTPEVLVLRTLDAEAVLLQVAATTKKIPNSRIPNYPSLPSQLLCQVHNITLHVGVNDTNSVPNVCVVLCLYSLLVKCFICTG
jgi:hypothetical protein